MRQNVRAGEKGRRGKRGGGERERVIRSGRRIKVAGREKGFSGLRDGGKKGATSCFLV